MKKILSVLVVTVSMNAMSDCMPAKASSKTLYPVSKEALDVVLFNLDRESVDSLSYFN